MSFKGFFSIFSSGGHFVQRSQTILAILVEVHPMNISVNLFLKSGHWRRRRCRLKKLLTDGRTDRRTDGRTTDKYQLQ